MQIALALLATICWALIAIVCVLAGVVAALLLAPLRFRASGEVRALEPVAGEVAFTALWGAIAVTRSMAGGWRWRAAGVVIGGRRRRTVHQTARERGTGEERAPEAITARADRTHGARPGKTKPRRGKDRGFWHELRRRGLLQRWASPALEAIGELLRAPRWERLNGTASFGTGDPAYTGVLCGALYAMAAGISAATRAALELRPDFMGPRADVAGDVALSVRPASVLWIAARLLWRGPTWETIRAYRSARRRRRAKASAAQLSPVKG